MIVLNYYPNDTVGCSVEMRIPDDDMTPDDVLEHFQRFLQASGYIFDEGETIKYVNERVPVFNPPKSFTISEDSLNVKNEDRYDFWDEDGFSFVGYANSGVRGGMSEDIIHFRV